MEELTGPAPRLKRAPRSVRRRFDEATLRQRLNALFALGALALVALVAVNSISFASLVSSRDTLLDRVDPASLEANQLVVAYLNEETGVRGYVLSANPVFLQPYYLGLAQVRDSSSRLTDLLAGEPDLLRLARKAEAAAARWENTYAIPAIAATRAHKSTIRTSQGELLKSKRLFDALRNRFADLEAALAAKRSAAQQGLSSATLALIVTLVVALFVVVLTGLFISRSLRVWVTTPLASIGTDSRAVADGDVEHTITPIGPPDLRRHAEDVESMRERIVAELGLAESSRAELALVNAELSRSNADLEQFAYVASHDLQEPLRKVTSFVQLLEQRYRGQLDERADQYIGFAVDGAKRMQVLINDLLAFSRVGRTTERFEPVDLAAAVSAALANLNTVITDEQARIELGPMPVVQGDESLLVSLWQNLLGNSLKFRSALAPLIRIEVVRSGQEWLFSVTDNGLGIEPRFAEKIFVLFQRLHSREAYSGTGIGLALAKRIVEAHGGRIWLDVDHQPGTRMCFTLPIPGPEVTDEHGE
jgi:signal transduction histidine kinase